MRAVNGDVIITKAELLATAVRPDQYPITALPEVAVIGKSNVGKSTFINTMAGRKGLARTSGQPGKTRVINFFNLDDRLCLVDLPGYGYAKVSKAEYAKWEGMIERYLLGRKQLELVIFLLDIRHEPGANDVAMAEWFRHYGHKTVYVATKADKIKRSGLQRQVSILRKGIDAEGKPEIRPFSGESHLGKEELWRRLDEMFGLGIFGIERGAAESNN